VQSAGRGLLQLFSLSLCVRVCVCVRARVRVCVRACVCVLTREWEQLRPNQRLLQGATWGGEHEQRGKAACSPGVAAPAIAEQLLLAGLTAMPSTSRNRAPHCMRAQGWPERYRHTVVWLRQRAPVCGCASVRLRQHTSGYTYGPHLRPPANRCTAGPAPRQC